MSLTLASIEDRIKSYETAVANALANFHGLSGGLTELKSLLAIATPVIEAVDPTAKPVLDVVNTVVNDLDNIMPAVGE